MSREDLSVALAKLSEAHGASELARAFGAVQRKVRTMRAVEGKVIGRLAGAVTEALQIRDEMKAGGASPEQLHASLEAVIRDVWPKGRSEPWHSCGTCSDYGLEMHDCPGDAACGRPRKHAPHDYGTPCWCEKGRRFREKPKPEPSEFTDAGKTPKRSQPTRFGGR